MFICPSSLSLSSILPTSGPVPANSRSARADPLPDVLPLSMPLVPTHNQTAPTSSLAYFSLGSRSPPPTAFSLTMPPGSGTPSVSESPGQTAETSAGTSLPPSSAFRSDSDVSTLSTSATTLNSSSAFSSSPSSSLSTNSLSVSGSSFTSTLTSARPLPTSSTQTFPETDSSSLPPTSTSVLPPSTASPAQPTLSSTSAISGSSSRAADSTTIVVLSTTLTTSVSSPSSSNLPSTSTYTITTVIAGQGGTTTDFVTTSSVLSTQPPGTAVNSTVSLSPGTVAAIVLGVVGAVAFSALWLFCARRRHRELVREAAHIPPQSHASRPLDDEILDVDEIGYGIGSTHDTENPIDRSGPVIEERYAGILAALHSTEGFGRGKEGGSTGGVYGSRHDTVDGEDDFARASSPTLPLHVLPPDDTPFIVPLSPPPPLSQPLQYQATQPSLPLSSYYMASRRKSSPGPEAATCVGGYSAAPSCYSYYARSQTLGSGSGSGSVDALSRTRTGSEEPLLGIGRATPEASAIASTPGGISPAATTDPGGFRPGLGSAFGGSPEASMYSPSGVHPALQRDTSGSFGTRTASGSGSYGYTRSATPSSFDVLRSVSSQGALSSAYSHTHGQGQGQGFRFGFNRQTSLSSGSTGKKTGSNRHSFGVPPTSFRSWRDRSSVGSDKEKRAEKQSLRDKDGKSRSRSWTSSASAQGSVDEKQGRGSPVMGVRAFLGRLRRAGHTPSPQSSHRDLSSPTRPSVDVATERAAVDRVTPPPIQVEAATPHRRRFSFILSNPDPHPPSPYSGVGNLMSSSHTLAHLEPHLDVPTGDSGDPKLVPFSSPGLGMPFPTRYGLATAPSPAPTEESRLAEGLLHPRLRTQGHSDASLRDFEDYSRPIGGVVKNRLHSTTTFGTQDEIDRSPNHGMLGREVLADEPELENEAADVFGPPKGIPRKSWSADDPSPPTTTRHSPEMS